jgi:hypothetical protein
MSENLLFIENWYEIIKKHTFKTIFLDLSNDEGDSILNYFEDMKHKIKNKFKKEDEKNLENLENRIDKVIQEEFKEGAFVRFSKRSPKDGKIFFKSGSCFKEQKFGKLFEGKFKKF